MPGILSDSALAQAFSKGDIKINPWNPEQLNPTSYDLTLGDEVTVYKDWVSFDERWEELQKLGVRDARDGRDVFPAERILDVKNKPDVVSWKIGDRGWVLKPGIGYLMHTREVVTTSKYVPILDGKSSIGRLFLQVHATAGYGDPGFDGQYTLEVIVQHPIRVFAGMRICQIRFHTMEGELEKPYNLVGHYKDSEARGARPSQAWKQFPR